MNKILLSNKDVEFIFQWKDEHKDLVRLGANPIKAIKIICTESRHIITGVRDGSILRLTVNHNGISLGSITFEILYGGLFRLVKDKTKLCEEDRQSVLSLYCSVMALIVFGNETVDLPQPKKKKLAHHQEKKRPSHKAQSNGITYILNMRSGEPRISAKGSHKSPNGIFSVRGHYRHYKNGKVVWIEEYAKGHGKKKDKTYKVGMKGEKL